MVGTAKQLSVLFKLSVTDTRAVIRFLSRLGLVRCTGLVAQDSAGRPNRVWEVPDGISIKFDPVRGEVLCEKVPSVP